MSKHLAKSFGALAVAIGAIAMFAPLAQAVTPPPPYEQFAGCPSPKTENPAVRSCLHSVVTGGTFKMGNKEVPITNPIHLTGGTGLNFTNFVYNSEGGLKPAKQKVPGGIVGLTGLEWLTELLGVSALDLYATTELAGTPQLSTTEIKLPIKVHLENTVLGKNCYVGSNANPIQLNLISGTTNPPPPNEPISGKEPISSFDPEETGIQYAKEGVFVDNSFAAPAATGCVLMIGFIPVNIDALVNLQSGLPSPAGTNTAIQNIDLEFVNAKRVYP